MSPLEDAQWQIAGDWDEGIDLVFEGVDLAEAIKYTVLQVIGSLLLRGKE